MRFQVLEIRRMPLMAAVIMTVMGPYNPEAVETRGS